MKTKRITEKEMTPLRIASLPSRPTAPSSFGGKGYTSTEMKEAFDKLPNLIAERLNSLIEDVSDTANGVSASIPTSIAANHTLKNMFYDITSGSFAEYLAVPGGYLSEVLTAITEELADIKRRLGGDADQ